jgi:hypothetical protein
MEEEESLLKISTDKQAVKVFKGFAEKRSK